MKSKSCKKPIFETKKSKFFNLSLHYMTEVKLWDKIRFDKNFKITKLNFEILCIRNSWDKVKTISEKVKFWAKVKILG